MICKKCNQEVEAKNGYCERCGSVMPAQVKEKEESVKRAAYDFILIGGFFAFEVLAILLAVFAVRDALPLKVTKYIDIRMQGQAEEVRFMAIYCFVLTAIACFGGVRILSKQKNKIKAGKYDSIIKVLCKILIGIAILLTVVVIFCYYKTFIVLDVK